MAIRTAIEIEEMMYGALESCFEGKISGTLYKEGCRPLDSELEDAVIAVGKTSAGQIQQGRAIVNIYVPDIDNNSKRLVPDKNRLSELANMKDNLLGVLNSADTDYLFRLANTPEAVAATDIKQHFVNINLDFECITFNN